MMFMPYYFFFLVTLILGSVMSLSSGNWVYVWMGLEINLLSFVPLVVSLSNDMETESILKYFLVQAFGSSFILFGAFVFFNYPNSMIGHSMCMYFLVFSLMIKMGMAPFHFWVPHVMGGVSWFSCMLLSVWQKIAPLCVLSSVVVVLDYMVLLFLGGLGSLVGGIGGMNQSQMRVLLAYSSIGHMGWMLVSMSVSFIVLVMYYVIYSFTTLGIMGVMNYLSLKMVNFFSFMSLPLYLVFLVGVLFFSLGGLPPFLGFYPKWMVLEDVSWSYSFVPLGMMLFGSLLNNFYYLSIFFNIILKSVYESFLSKCEDLGSVSVMVYSSFVVLGTCTLGLAYMFM